MSDRMRAYVRCRDLLAFSMMSACSAPDSSPSVPVADAAALPPEAPLADAAVDAVDVHDAGAPPPSDAPAADSAIPPSTCPVLEGAAPPVAQGLGKAVFVVGGYERRTLISSDGVHWDHDARLLSPDAGEANPALHAFASANGLLLAAADRAIITTRDVLTWNAPNVAEVYPGFTFPSGYLASAYGQGKFVVAATHSNDQTAFYASADGIAWPTPHFSATSSGRKLRAMAFGAGHFVAVGDNYRTVTSENGVDWHDDAESPGGGYRAIAFGTDVFAAVGQNGRIATTHDGKTWQVVGAGTDGGEDTTGFGNLASVIFADGRFVACSAVDCFASKDGVAWTPLHADPHPDGALAAGGGVFIGIAFPATLLVSRDAAHWVPVFCGAEPALTSLTLFEGN